jgi:hypothetical protein
VLEGVGGEAGEADWGRCIVVLKCFAVFACSTALRALIRGGSKWTINCIFLIPIEHGA